LLCARCRLNLRSFSSKSWFISLIRSISRSGSCSIAACSQSFCQRSLISPCICTPLDSHVIYHKGHDAFSIADDTESANKPPPCGPGAKKGVFRFHPDFLPRQSTRNQPVLDCFYRRRAVPVIRPKTNRQRRWMLQQRFHSGRNMAFLAYSRDQDLPCQKLDVDAEDLLQVCPR